MTQLGHTALVFQDPHEVVERLVPELLADLERGAKVVVVVDDAVAAEIRERIGDREDVRYVSRSVDACRPVDAIEILWQAANQWLLLEGGSSVTAVGQAGFSGGPADEEWHWYEAAVNEVLAEEPIKSVCLYDETSLGEGCVHEACRTHREVVAGDAGLVSTYAGPTEHRPPVPPLPARDPDVHFDGFDDPGAVADVRAAVRAATADCPEDLVDQLLLVVSELVTNTIRHAGGCRGFSMWVDDAAVSLRVVDAGPGIDDPYAPLRPPNLGVRGVGLWLCSRETSRFTVTPAPGGGTVATATLHRTA